MSWERFNKMPGDVKENLVNNPDAHRRQSAAGGRAAALKRQSQKIEQEREEQTNEMIEAEKQAQLLDDADKHAENNRIAWDDDYKP